MKNFQTRYKKTFSVLSLAAYIFILGYSLFHFHKCGYFPENSINIESKIYSNSGFHQNGFCQISHFSNNQLTGDVNLFSDYKPTETLAQQFNFTPSLISSEINSLLRRGPPSLS
jgi:hypothetical protein